jgi:hypothetical protein
MVYQRHSRFLNSVPEVSPFPWVVPWDADYAGHAEEQDNKKLKTETLKAEIRGQRAGKRLNLFAFCARVTISGYYCQT